jgi:hypothetical protein
MSSLVICLANNLFATLSSILSLFIRAKVTPTPTASELTTGRLFIAIRNALVIYAPAKIAANIMPTMQAKYATSFIFILNFSQLFTF